MNARITLALLATLALGFVLGFAFTTGAEARAPLDAAESSEAPAGAGLDERTVLRLVSVLEALEKRLATELPKSTPAPVGAPAQRIDLDAKEVPSQEEIVRLLRSIDGRLSRTGGSSNASLQGWTFGAESSASREEWLSLLSSRPPINYDALERFVREHTSEDELIFSPDLYFYGLRDVIRDFGWPSYIERWDVTKDEWKVRYEGLSIPYSHAESPIIELDLEFLNGQLTDVDYDLE